MSYLYVFTYLTIIKLLAFDGHLHRLRDIHWSFTEVEHYPRYAFGDSIGFENIRLDAL